MDEPTLARFLSKIRILDNGCWEWTGTISDDGYGVFSMNRGNHLAHRVSYKHFVGPIPEDRPHLDHLCHTRDLSCPGGGDCPHRRCVCWVGHLEPVTPLENLLRGRRNGMATHCANGHEMTPENTYYPPKGGRECRTCRHEGSVRWMAIHNPGVQHGTETHCPKNHPYKGDNLIINVNGARVCRICKNDWSRRQMRAKRALARGYLPLLPDSTVCPVGHDLIDDDSYFVHQGQLVCLICMAPDGSRSQKSAESAIAAANSALRLGGMLF